MPNTKVCSGPCGRELAVNALNFRRDAAKKSGFRSRCRDCLSLVNVKAFQGAVKGPEGRGELEGPAPKGFVTRGRSTHYDAQGNIISEWVKTKKDEEEQLEALAEALSSIAEPWKAKAKPIKAPAFANDDLLCVYPMGDPHLGMFSWHEETGKDFDLDTAEANLVEAVDHLVNLAPKAKRALIISLGDFFHADNSYNQTTRGTKVDVDTRWAKVLRIGIRTMRRIIDKALEKHEQVTVICEIGNHDSHSAIMLALALAQFYEKEPRVEIDTSPSKFHWYRFGKNLIGVTHGDTVKAKDLPGVMACDRKKDWGETDYRYFYCGHIHHDTVKEYPGVVVESFRTLAPADAWHHSSGYRSGQDMKLDIIHKEYGRVNRHVVGIHQIWDK